MNITKTKSTELETFIATTTLAMLNTNIRSFPSETMNTLTKEIIMKDLVKEINNSSKRIRETPVPSITFEAHEIAILSKIGKNDEKCTKEHTDEEKLINKINKLYISKMIWTSDLYALRDIIQSSIPNENGQVRNDIVESLICENEKLKLIYDWTKFQRIIQYAKSKWHNETSKLIEQKDISTEFANRMTVNINGFINTALLENGFDKNLFFKRMSLIGRNDFRTFESMFHFITQLVNEDFPIDILYYCLLAGNITGENLIAIAKNIEKKTNITLQALTVNKNTETCQKQYCLV